MKAFPLPILSLRDCDAEPSDGDESDESFDGNASLDDDGAIMATAHRAKERKTHRRKGPAPAQRARRVSVDPSKNWIGRLPVELLVHIFSFVVDVDGAIPHLPRLARVSRQWHAIASTEFLWRSVDVSPLVKFNDASLTALRTRVSPRLHTFVVRSNKHLHEVALRQAVQSWSLHTLRINDCTKVRPASALSIARDASLTLRRLDVSGSSASSADVASTLKACTHLDELRLNFPFPLPPTFYASLSDQLRVLDLSTGQTLVFLSGDLVALQERCPLLEKLLVCNAAFTPQQLKLMRRQHESGLLPGFPHLRYLCLAQHFSFAGHFTEAHLLPFVARSPALETLDIRGCSGLARDWPEQLLAAPTQLRSLFVERTSTSFAQVAQWAPSLRHLHCAHSTPSDLAPLAHLRHLRTLDLTATPIAPDTLLLIVSTAPSLAFVSLASCRALPRGIKRDWSAPLLPTLAARLNQFKNDDGHNTATVHSQ